MTDDRAEDSSSENTGGLDRAQRLSALADLFDPHGPPDLEETAGPCYWPKLTARQAREAWDDLGGWVAQLVERFSHLDHHVIPRCWYRHPGHVEALAALRDHERVSYATTAAPTAAVDWHRAFRDMEARLRDWTAQLACGATHEPRPRPIFAADTADWERFVDDDVNRRDQAALAAAVDDGEE